MMISTPLPLILFAGLLLISPATSAQKTLPPCNCDALKSAERGYADLPSEKQATEIVNDMVNNISRYSKLRFNERIQVLEANCPTPMALICPVKLPNGRPYDQRLILYNNAVLRRLALRDSSESSIDRQILAHEVAHHVFGHGITQKRVGALIQTYQSETGRAQQVVRKHKAFQQQSQEIEADFFALWLLKTTDKRFDFKSFITNFDLTIIQKFELIARKRAEESGKVATSSHPLIADRIKVMSDFWDELNQSRYRQAIFQPKRGYFATAASVAFIDLEPKRVFWDVSVLAGLTVAGKTAFSVDGDPVDGLLYSAPDAWNTQFGLSASRFQWGSPWRVEGDVAFSRQRYGTTQTVKDTKSLLETFETSYLTAYPRVTFSPVGPIGGVYLGSGRLSWSLSAGINARLPLGLTYQSFTNPASSSTNYSLKPTVNPRLSVGIGWVQKSLLPRHSRLVISYERQYVQIEYAPAPTALSHNIDCTLYYALVRR